VLLDQRSSCTASSMCSPVPTTSMPFKVGCERLIDGYPDTVTPGYNDFRPDNPVYRAQLRKMIDGVLGLTVGPMSPP